MELAKQGESKRSFHVVYDTRTGDIVHIRGVTVLPGATEPSEHDVDTRAREAAARLGGPDVVAHLAVIRSDRAALKPGIRYRVRLDTKELIAIE